MRRVVVTGMGIVCPLGRGTEFVWSRLLAGHSGIQKVSSCEVSDLPCRIAGVVPEGLEPGQLNLDALMSAKERKKSVRFILMAVAADDALEDAGFRPESEDQKERTGVLIGSGIGGLPEIYDTSVILKDQGPRRVSPFFIPGCLINLASGQISIRHGLKGPNHAVVTACASGSHAIGDAARLIQWGDADVMVAGGAESSVCRIGLSGFSALKALSTNFNETPELASRPWDRDRDGFVMGEGAGIVVLEAYDHAVARGARIYGEIVGYGMSGDAYHVAAPAEDGNGAARSMRAALKRANLNPEQVGYVNAHGTSTPLGDAIELRAIHQVFGAASQGLSVSSTKSAIGHLLGAAGGVEAVFSLKALETGILPPTLNLTHCSEDTDVDLIPLRAQEKKVTYVLSNSFGFGGTNASLVFGRI